MSIHAAFKATSFEDLLMTTDDEGQHARSNLLQMLAQWNTGPRFHDEVTTEIQCYMEVATGTIALYNEHDALDFRGGPYDDTAVAKACASGNERMIRWLVRAGASASLPWLILIFPHWVGSFYSPHSMAGPVDGSTKRVTPCVFLLSGRGVEGV